MIIKQAAQLRMLLLDMEQGLGLETLTTVDRDILYAVEILSELGVCIKSDDIRKHEIVKNITAPTFYRALKVLLGKEFLVTWPGTIKGSYTLNQRAVRPSLMIGRGIEPAGELTGLEITRNYGAQQASEKKAKRNDSGKSPKL